MIDPGNARRKLPAVRRISSDQFAMVYKIYEYGVDSSLGHTHALLDGSLFKRCFPSPCLGVSHPIRRTPVQFETTLPNPVLRIAAAKHTRWQLRLEDG